MASIQTRHSDSCKLDWKHLNYPREECTCPRGPTYYVCDPEIPGGKVRVGRNRKTAERKLAKIQTELDEGTYLKVKRVGFSTWADQWIGRLDSLQQSTLDAYRGSMAYAKAYFREKRVDRITATDVSNFNTYLRDDHKLSSTTRHKHVSTLSTCLKSAVAHGFASSNPVPNLPKNERPKKDSGEAGYFENAEIARIVKAMTDGLERAACLLALMTGMRIGEVLGIQRATVDIDAATIRVMRTKTGRVKHDKNRDVDLPAPAVKLLRDWLSKIDLQPADLVFPPPAGSRSAYFSEAELNSFLADAMQRAGVSAIGPNGKKRTFHSLRHTFAKTALEQGVPLTWLRRQLGHSTIAVTDRLYGHWERLERKRMAAKLNKPFSKLDED